tara:strand:+ start:1834 stop:2766 length:933 start_codon:yes stop_codon:yes gene_type:complete
MIKTFVKRFNRTNIWTKIVVFCVIFLFSAYLINKNTSGKHKEGFIQKEKFVTKYNENIYDDFYSSIYDELVFDNVKNNYEIGEIIRTTKMEPERSIVLDVGSGSGHHVQMLNEKGIDTHGLDLSKDMIERSKKLYPKLNFKQGDVLDSMNYNPNTFTHINSLYFTIYYIQNKRMFFENCFKWLKPGGYLNLHLVNRDKFNPIINVADPLIFISSQKYAKERITNSVVKFKDFQYKADFKYKPGNDICHFEETFKDDNSGHVRLNKHKFYMETQKNILAKAKDVGFILHGKIDMVYCKYEYQYLYILYKPE